MGVKICGLPSEEKKSWFLWVTALMWKIQQNIQIACRRLLFSVFSKQFDERKMLQTTVVVHYNMLFTSSVRK